MWEYLTDENDNPIWKKGDHARFVKDMKRAGLEPYLYKGRFGWVGPAVDVEDLQDALSNTKVKCQWDQMGLDHVVYPKSR